MVSINPLTAIVIEYLALNIPRRVREAAALKATQRVSTVEKQVATASAVNRSDTAYRREMRLRAQKTAELAQIVATKPGME